MQKPMLVDANNSLLLVIDIQARLAAAMPDKPRQQASRNSSILATAANTLAIPLLYTEQYPKGLGQTVPELHSCLGDSQAIEKTCFSCYDAEGFIDTLEQYNRKQIILCGMETHVCVLQTALQLMQQGYTVFVVEDAVVSRHTHHHHNAIARMQQAGVVISNHESVLFEWLRDAQHPEFKSLSKLIR